MTAIAGRTSWADGKTNEEIAQIKEIESAGVNHMILCITDPFILKAFTGKEVDVPDAQEQLQLIHDSVMPAFTGAAVTS